MSHSLICRRKPFLRINDCIGVFEGDACFGSASGNDQIPLLRYISFAISINFETLLYLYGMSK